nr:hypothetical protein [Tanacetum cinerariifolium]
MKKKKPGYSICWLGTSANSFAGVVGSEAKIDLVIVEINTDTLLVSVESRRRTRPSSEEHGAIVKISTNNQMKQLVSWLLTLKSFGVDAVEDFKEYTLKDYYCWLKTYCCWYKLKLLDNAADLRLRLLEESAAANEKMKR